MKFHHRLVSVLLAIGALAGASPAQAQNRGGREVPYATNFSINVSPYATSGMMYSPDVVPATKRLVIEYVTVAVSASPGDKPVVHVNDAVNGYSRAYWIPVTLAEPGVNGAADYYRASLMVKLNYEGNGNGGPAGQCLRNSSSIHPMSCHFQFSGYLVDK